MAAAAILKFSTDEGLHRRGKEGGRGGREGGKEQEISHGRWKKRKYGEKGRYQQTACEQTF